MSLKPDTGRGRASVLGLAALLLMVSCQGSLPLPAPQMSPVAGGQVTEAIVGAPGPLNPLFEQEANSREIDSLIYQGLTTVDRDQHLVGLLASGWSVSDDKLGYLVTLRSGVRWADGKPFTIEDVMFTFGVLQSQEYQQATAQYWKEIKVERVDDKQVKFTLKAPSSSFPFALQQGIIPKHLFQAVPISSMASSPYSGAKGIGTGPFKVGSISPDRRLVTLDRNRYANPKPYLDHFVFRGYPSLGDAIDAVSTGQADTAGVLELPQISALTKRPDLSLMRVKTFTVTAVLFNLSQETSVFFNPQAVRQALSMAIDRKKIVREVLDGRAEVAPGPIPPTSWAYSKEKAEKLSYDPAQASKLLSEAGWTMNVQTGLLQRGGRDFVVGLVTADAYPYRQVAEAISSQLRQLGIGLEIEPVPASVLISKYLIGKQYQMAVTAFANGPDPDQYSFWHSGASKDSLNFGSNFVPRQALIDKDLEDGRTALDRETRRAAYADYQDLMADASPALFLFSPHYTYVVSKRVHGIRTNPVIEDVDRFEYAAEWYISTKGL